MTNNYINDQCVTLYNTLKGKPIPCTLRDNTGNYISGEGVVCGYQENYLIVGFPEEYNGCIKEFTSPVIVDGTYPSYRFLNIEKLIMNETVKIPNPSPELLKFIEDKHKEKKEMMEEIRQKYLKQIK